MEIIAPKHTMSLGNAPHPPKGKLIYPHTINILHLSFHHPRHFLSPIQHAHTSLKSSKSNTYKTKRPLYSTCLYKGLYIRYLLYFILSIALSFCPWEDEGRCLGIITIQTRKVWCDFGSFQFVFYTVQFWKRRLFHTLFFVSHTFSTNPVPTIFFIIVCSSGGLQVIWLFKE